MRYRYRNEEEMKDSGIKWIGDIPKIWGIVKGKYVFSNKKLKNSGKLNNILSLTLNGVIDRDRGKTEGLQPESFDGYQEFNTENLVFKLIDLENINTSRVGYVYKDGLMSPAYIRLEKMKTVNSKYYYYNYYDYYNKNIYNFLGSVGVRSALNATDLLEMKVIRNSKDEQEKIVKFLEKKKVEFDSLILKKKVLIEKLEGAKKSLISEVVTGKVKVIKTNGRYELVERKKEEMKDSGVEWLDNVPNEWDLKRSSYVLKFSKGLSITKENLQEEGIPCMNYGEIHSKYGFEVNPNKNNLKCVSDEYLKNNSNALITKGDFIFADTSEDIQGCGNFSYLNSNTNIFAGYHTIIARPIEKVNSRYLAYLFMSEEWRTQIRTKVSGVKVLSITQGILKNSKIILAGWEEEKDIVEYLDNKVSSANLIIDNVRKQIEKIKEAKQSLISEVVTGKIEILE